MLLPSLMLRDPVTHLARIAARRMGGRRHLPRKSSLNARHTPCKVLTA
jgi:hypothetical protein